jgi:hypothetical protein
VQLDSIRNITAECLIDTVVLAQRFVLADSIVYDELQAYDRSMEDPPKAVLSCVVCSSRAWVIHPSEAGPDTPVFPV